MYGILYVEGARALRIDEPSRKEDKVVSFCGGSFMAQFGKPSPLSIPQMGSAAWRAVGGLDRLFWQTLQGAKAINPRVATRAAGSALFSPGFRNGDESSTRMLTLTMHFALNSRKYNAQDMLDIVGLSNPLCISTPDVIKRGRSCLYHGTIRHKGDIKLLMLSARVPFKRPLYYIRMIAKKILFQFPIVPSPGVGGK